MTYCSIEVIACIIYKLVTAKLAKCILLREVILKPSGVVGKFSWPMILTYNH